MNVDTFADLADEFALRTQKIVWCSAATVDRQGRPRSRILHPVWEGTTGWITARPESLKTRHLARVPYLSLAYVADIVLPVYVDCFVEWEEHMEEKRRVWHMIANTPPPVGFDPTTAFRGGVEDPGYGLLKLTPWRVEVANIPNPTEARVWHAPER